MEPTEIAKKRTWARRMLTLNANRLERIVDLSESLTKVSTTLEALELAYKNLCEIEEAAFVAGCDCDENDTEAYRERYIDAKAKAVEFKDELMLLESLLPSPMIVDEENIIPVVSEQITTNQDSNCLVAFERDSASSAGPRFSSPLEYVNDVGSTEPRSNASSPLDLGNPCTPLESQEFGNTVAFNSKRPPTKILTPHENMSNMLGSRASDLVCTPLGSQGTDSLRTSAAIKTPHESTSFGTQIGSKSLQTPHKLQELQCDHGSHLMSTLQTQTDSVSACPVDRNSSPLRQQSLINGDSNISRGNDHSHYNFLLGANLPKMNLPIFKGGYSEWVSFKDIFMSLIDKDPRLNDTVKLHYLKTSVVGEAAALLSTIPITSQNYKLAWDRLNARFDRQGTVVDSYISKMIGFEDLGSRTIDLGQRIDNIEEILGSLEVMGGYALTKDPWIIRMILNRIDNESRRLWAAKSADFVSPSLEQLRAFLRKRRITIEQLSSWSRNPSSQKYEFKPKQNTIQRPKSMLTYKLKNCPLCNKNHRLYQCDQFKKMSVEDRFKKANELSVCFHCLHTGHSYNDCQSNFSCSDCTQKHHTLLHKVRTSVLYSNSKRLTKFDENILATVKVIAESLCGLRHQCRALLDSGSQVSIISEYLLKKLLLKRRKLNIEISGISSSKTAVAKGAVKLKLFSIYDLSKHIEIEALILPEITHNLPEKDIPINDSNWLKRYQLADPLFYKSERIDILLGVDSYYEILRGGPIEVAPKIWLQNTIFGNIVAGGSFIATNQVRVNTVTLENLTNWDDTLKRFWEVENLPGESQDKVENKDSEAHFLATYERLPGGRYQVRLPFASSPANLGSSESTAYKRLMWLEKRFRRNQEFHEKYVDFMNLYISRGYMVPVSNGKINDQKQCCYLPHHGVLSSGIRSKLRVVFNASAKTSSMLSLNDILQTGSNLQLNLIQILLNFMVFPFVIIADIEKMFLNIDLHPDDRAYQRVLWRKNIHQSITHYEMTTVTFGEVCSPFLAMRVIRQLAKDEKINFPQAADVLNNSIYMDDIITGAHSITDLKELKKQLNGIMASAGFTLKKWASNCDELLKDISMSDRLVGENIDIEEETSIKTLGILWNIKADSFSFKMSFRSPPVLTKRGLLSESAKLYDPFGWLSPVIILIKQLYQALWLIKIDWDEPLPEEISSKWIKIRNSLSLFDSLKLSRWLKLTTSSTFELHGFSDASEKAFGAVVYFKLFKDRDEYFIRILMSKTRVAPIKNLTIPRLELCGALLLSELMSFVMKSFIDWMPKCFCWTDSKVVLAWIKTQPSSLKTFVSNRIEKIQTLTSTYSWGYVQSSQNPADLASRGLLPEQLVNCELWWQGPLWLRENNIQNNESTTIQIIPELKKTEVKTLLNISRNDILSRYSSLDKLLKIAAHCQRFIQKCRHQTTSKFISPEDIENALIQFCRIEQYAYFKDTIDRLKANKTLKSKDSLMSLNPFIDDTSILRVGGRLQNSNLKDSIKHPIILPKESRLSILIVEKEHIAACHIGVNATFSNVRQRFWIPHLRNLVKRVIFQCAKCFRHRPRLNNQQMGIIPYDRVNPARAFSKVGIDFAGPFQISLKRGRGRALIKIFVAVFVCFTTKAVHLEHVMNLTTDGCLAAINRFVSRRGRPHTIFSDNGTNFVGSKNVLNESFKILQDEKFNENLSTSLAINRIEWRFIPPRSPEFGGLWEATVKSFKACLGKTIGNEKLSMEEFLTILAQIECSLNSRPLCYITNDIENIEVITPGHFLVNSHLKGIPEMSHESCSLRSRWIHVQSLQANFWNSWSKNYLISLNQRQKNLKVKQNIQPGQVGILIDQNKPYQWPLAIVQSVTPGPDGLVRVLDLKLPNNTIMRRPVSKFCPLPFNNNVSDVPSETAGSDVKAD